MDLDLKQKLLAMVDEDRRVRVELGADGSLFRGYAERMGRSSHSQRR